MSVDTDSTPETRRTPSASATLEPESAPVRDVTVTEPSPARRRFHLRRPERRAIMLAVVLTTQLMVVLDGTIVNVALPDIQRGLDFSPSQLSWVINAYGLTFGGLLMLGARTADLLGRRRTFLGAITVFALGSLLGGLSPDPAFLLAARALQGIGGAFAAPATLSMLMAMYPEGRERVRAIGIFAAISVGGAASGLLAGGILTQLASWRWVFFVNVPIGVAVVALGSVVVSETARERGRFDLLGAVTSTVGVGAIVYGLVSAASHSWTSVQTLGAFGVGIVLLATFVAAERTASQPILPLRLVTDPGRTAANIARGLLFAGGYGIFFFLSQYLQDVRGYSPLEAGLAFLPIPLSVFAVSQLTTRVLVHRFSVQPLIYTGLLLSTAGMVISITLNPHSGYGVILPTLVLFGAGNGISFVTLTNRALTGVAPADAGAASGLVNVMQQLGAAVGVAALVTVFGAATSHSGSVDANKVLFTHGVDHVFFAGTILLVASMLVVAAGTLRSRRSVDATAEAA